MNALLDHRETADRYQGEMFRQGDHRVILCKNGIQWILQRQKKGAAVRWKAVGYCTTRAALTRLWTAQGCALCAELAALPITVWDARHG